MKTIEFSEWLRIEIEKNFSSQAEFAEKSGLSPSQISRILNMTSTPSGEALREIARALGYPPDAVFRQAGLLPESVDLDKESEEMMHLFEQLTEDQQEQMIAMARFFVDRRGQKARTRPAEG